MSQLKDAYPPREGDYTMVTFVAENNQQFKDDQQNDLSNHATAKMVVRIKTDIYNQKLAHICDDHTFTLESMVAAHSFRESVGGVITDGLDEKNQHVPGYSTFSVTSKANDPDAVVFQQEETRFYKDGDIHDVVDPQTGKRIGSSYVTKRLQGENLEIVDQKKNFYHKGADLGHIRNDNTLHLMPLGMIMLDGESPNDIYGEVNAVAVIGDDTHPSINPTHKAKISLR